ncbi:PH domain-containing protein [Apilactobacillus sp. EABW-1NA]|uniref:PH domain-containing protein n=1 Tax=Apilactobacillus sp. EABW-1NA TaxID=2984137 RepID=UPI0025AF1D94|nr:PH domain-containing protein [Apilactobacillus sp. EABW-1NA]MDN2612756.1 PH domain-containing protein [Apilactobacillus sp. EABW-1NA]
MQDKHLSPLNLVNRLKDILIAIFLASFIGDPLHIDSFKLGIIFVIITIVWDILSYLCFTYSIEDSQIVIKKGVIFKKVIHVPFARIQSIEHSQYFLFRPFDVEKLQINNASKGSSKDKIQLDAVKTYVGKVLEEKHKQYQNQDVNDEVEQSDIAKIEDSNQEEANTQDNGYAQYKISTKDIALYTFTSFRVFITMFLIVHITHGEVLDFAISIYQKGFGSNMISLIAFTIMAIIIALLLSFIYTMFQFYDFTLVKEGKYLEYEKGLFTRNKVRLSTDRIQSVLIEQNVMGKLLKIMTVKIIMASDGSDEESSQAVVLPILNSNKYAEMMNDFFEWIPLKTVEKFNSRKRSIWLFFRNFDWVLFIIPIVIYFVGWTTLTYSLVVIGVFTFFYTLGNAYFKYRVSSIGLTGNTKDDYLIVSNGFLFKQRTYYVGWHEIQSMHFESSVFMKRNNLAHIVIRIRKGDSAQIAAVHYIDYDGAKKIYDWYRQ